MTIRASGPRTWSTAGALSLALSATMVVGAAPATASVGADTSSPQGQHARVATEKSGELKRGDKGAAVKKLQQDLTNLGYWVGPVDSHFDDLTAQGVIALQKAAGIGRDGVVGPATRKALKDKVRPKAQARYADSVEIDLKRQLLIVVRDGKTKLVFNTSTGSGKKYQQGGKTHTATTPKGAFRVFRGVDAWDKGPLGKLYRPKYFNGGIAVHGYQSVPAYPASHGCARVSVKAMDVLWAKGYLKNKAVVVVR